MELTLNLLFVTLYWLGLSVGLVRVRGSLELELGLGLGWGFWN